MAKREPKAKRVKWDESDFAFQIEDRTNAGNGRPLDVIENRVVDVPIRKKNIKVGKASVSVKLCFHGKPMKHDCPTCEFEAPRIPAERLTKATV